jgi:hypothetical protein
MMNTLPETGVHGAGASSIVVAGGGDAMMLKMVLAASVLLATPVMAQEISEAADQAMWCASAIALLDTLGVYPADAVNPVALSRQWSRRAFQEFDAAGFSDAEVDMLIQSYAEEVAMQVPDYLVSSDEDALRHNIYACSEP